MRFTLILILCLINSALIAQYEGSSFVPFERYNGKSSELKEKIRANTNTELAKLNSKTNSVYSPSIRLSRDRILSGINDEIYIRNDSLETLISDMGSEIISTSHLKLEKIIFLIKADPEVNAASYMINVIEINLGTILASHTQDELRVIIGHEVAHLALYHVINRIFDAHNSDLNGQARKIITDNLQRRGSAEDIMQFQSLATATFRNSREDELEADSLSLVFAKNAHHDVNAGIMVINKLGYQMYDGDIPIYELTRQIFTPRYPQKSVWFAPRLLIYNKVPRTGLSVLVDSLETHPDHQYRLNRLEEISGFKIDKKEGTNIDILLAHPLAFELMQAAFDSKSFEVALYLALMLRLENPDNDYLVSMITQIFMDLFRARKTSGMSNNFYQYVNYNTAGMPKSLVDINAFLFNLSSDDLLNISYHFLNNPETFNSNNERHYLLMYDISTWMENESLNSRVVKMYQNRFPDGIYQKEIR